MTPLRRRMIEDMKPKDLSARTIEAYTSRVGTFARYFGRSPQDLGRDDVRAYLLHLIQKKKVSWSVYNQTLAALRLLYEVTLGRKDVLERISFPEQPKRLPVVLSLDEVARLHTATGKWKWQDYDWHAFSYGHATAQSGDKAIVEYLGLEAADLIIIPEQHSFPSLPACHLANAHLPQFQGSCFDVMVRPEDLSWTMAFTHEEGWCGPYFSRREWVVPDAD